MQWNIVQSKGKRRCSVYLTKIMRKTTHQRKSQTNKMVILKKKKRSLKPLRCVFSFYAKGRQKLDASVANQESY